MMTTGEQHLEKRTVDISEKLFLIRYQCAEESHLKIKEHQACLTCANRACTFFCPADVYEWNAGKKEIEIAYENCVECGTCRIACPEHNIAWVYPTGGYGIAYKFG